MNPMIKYRGGKSKEIPHFLHHMPEKYNRYIEPFFGGGALYFYLEPQKAIINDVNAKLYSFYQEMKECYPEARVQLDELQKLYETNQDAYEEEKANHPEERVENKNEALYYKIRDMFNRKIESQYLDSVIYFFINKTAYSGMIRYNANGEFNVPFGRYRNLNTKLITEEHNRLLCHTDIFNLPCKALLVIGKTPLTEELYSNYIVEEYEKSYAVNIRNGRTVLSGRVHSGSKTGEKDI